MRSYMNAAKYGLDKVFFGGCFIRGEISCSLRLSCAPRLSTIHETVHGMCEVQG